MIYFSALLKSTPTYQPAADRLFSALDSHSIPYGFLENTRDIWARDFMPVRTGSGKYVSFRYEPGYPADHPGPRTDFRKDVAPLFPLENLIFSDINLDGGNIVFSPSREKVVISNRVFEENRDISEVELVRELERLLEAQVIIIPSLPSDMTGHADGMTRFLDENTVLGNRTPYRAGLETRIKAVLRGHGIEVIDFPYFSSPKNSAIGCYLNFLETDTHLLLPVFGTKQDREAAAAAQNLFRKPIVPVNINEIAVCGGVLNCISWEC